MKIVKTMFSKSVNPFLHHDVRLLSFACFQIRCLNKSAYAEGVE
jgi:hypothetical protein